jgi:hypothetical protein
MTGSRCRRQSCTPDKHARALGSGANADPDGEVAERPVYAAARESRADDGEEQGSRQRPGAAAGHRVHLVLEITRLPKAPRDGEQPKQRLGSRRQ